MIQELILQTHLQFILGGILIGLGISIIYLGTAIIPGASTFLESTLSYISKKERFKDYKSSRDWRIVFTAVIILGSLTYTTIFEGSLWTTNVSILRLFIGGLLVGIGTRIGKGCASGHGICGVGSLSKASILNAAIFLTVAIFTALTVKTAGITP